jgi:catechol 2,3-dioxygenase-like lactoylglutathione lyase family enzyme
MQNKFTGIGANVLVRGSFEASYDFWTKKVGLIATWGDRQGPYVSLSLSKDEPRAALALFARSNMTMWQGYVVPTADQTPDTLMAVIYLPEGQLAGEYQRMKANGVEFLGEPQFMKGWGMWCVYFRDPEGNLFGIYEGNM